LADAGDHRPGQHNYDGPIHQRHPALLFGLLG
jgi:hypothetical protein